MLTLRCTNANRHVQISDMVKDNRSICIPEYEPSTLR